MGESKLFIPQKTELNAGDIEINTERPTDATSSERRIETNQNQVISAGKQRIIVTNAGNINGGQFATATANGFPIAVNGSKTFDAYLDPVANQYRRPGQVVVITNGATVWIDVLD